MNTITIVQYLHEHALLFNIHQGCMGKKLKDLLKRNYNLDTERQRTER